MSGFDHEGVFYTDQRLGVVEAGAAGATASAADASLLPARIQGRFRQFLKEWSYKQTQVYVETLRANYAKGQYFLEVNMAHLLSFDDELGGLLRDRPEQYLPLLEDAAKEVLDFTTNKKDLRDIQVHLTGFDRMSSLRGIGASDISKLVNIPGIVIGITRSRSKIHKMTLMCRNCNDTKVLYSRPGMGSVTPPRRCSSGMMGTNGSGDSASCPLDPYVVLTEHSTFIDTQLLKVQERPEMVPTGDMPRHLTAVVDRFLVNRAKPGTRVKLTGVYGVFDSSRTEKREMSGTKANATRKPYLRVVGIEAENEGAVSFTPEDEEEMHELSRTPDLYEKISSSIAPLIWGHEDIKKAVACLLFGGSRKLLPDGMRLRGDINVLLLGDPSVAKSQFLKFAEQVAPIAVYTSGKGSSAAGLTASVIRDPGTREFHLEGGALVLADGGVVCIDEFDKMREQDRVAIHEAMEQQTISIAKAGITTILNSRTSVLAAANPIFGRYDTERTASENISLQTTILSRFDMIFVIVDKHDAEQDARLSKHVIQIHKNSAMLVDDDNTIPIATLKKYIAFCRQNCNSRLSPDAAETLRNHYVNIRAQVARTKKENDDAPIPITVRQLEAITRISESLARMKLQTEANSGHVAEAIRLFKFSTVQAASTGSIAQGSGSALLRQQIQRAEDFIKARVPISHRISRQTLLQQYLKTLNTDSIPPFTKALEVMNQRGEIQLENQNRTVRRQR